MKKKYPKIQTCNNCNSLFIECTYLVFCCKKCQHEYFKKASTKKKGHYKQSKSFKVLPMYKVFEPVKRLCSVCDTDISGMRKDAKYCSKKCKSKAVKEQKEQLKKII